MSQNILNKHSINVVFVQTVINYFIQTHVWSISKIWIVKKKINVKYIILAKYNRWFSMYKSVLDKNVRFWKYLFCFRQCVF